MAEVLHTPGLVSAAVTYALSHGWVPVVGKAVLRIPAARATFGNENSSSVRKLTSKS